MKSNKIGLILCLILIGGCSSTETPKEEYLPIEETILANKSSWYTSDVLYEVPVSALEGVQGSELYRFNDTLLSAYYKYDSELKTSFYYVDLISLQTGERLYQKVFSDMSMPEVQILEDYIVIKDIDKKKAYVLDEYLNDVNEYTFNSYNYVLDNKGEKAYVLTEDKGIEGITLATQELSSLLENTRDMSLSKVSKDYATFTYIDVIDLRKKGGVLYLNTGEIEVFPLEKSFRNIQYESGVWLVELQDSSNYVVGENNNIKLLQAENMDSISLLNSTHMIGKSHTKEYQTILMLYDREGTFISSVELVGTLNPLAYDMVWLEEYNGYLFTLMSQEDGMDHLFFLDMSKIKDGSNLTLRDINSLYDLPLGNAVSMELYKQAEDIGNTYGVSILIAEQCDTTFPGHSADLLVSEEDIEIALNTLEATLDTYPKGFFDQLKYDTYDTIEIQLVSTLVKDSSTEDITYISGGLVYQEESKLVMVLDARGTFEEINTPLKQTIYHEFSHMIDRKLGFRNNYYENQVYSENTWNALNPDGFTYNDTYYGVLDSKYIDYFIDQYACTNATEDRARIMEMAAMGNSEVFKKSGIRSKLEYYSKSIRDGFNTTDWPEKTVWEVVLN